MIALSRLGEKRNGVVASYWGARQFGPMAGRPSSEL